MGDVPDDVKLPIPTDYETEKLVLGAALDREGCRTALLEALDVEDFHLDAHREIFRALAGVRARGGQGEGAEVAAWLHDRNTLEQCGGREYLRAIAFEFVSEEALASHLTTLRDLRVRRQLMEMGEQLYLRGQQMQGSPAEQIAHASDRLEGLANLVGGGAPLRSLAEVVERLGGIGWLWPGWIPRGHLTLVVAAPGAGKSAFALHLAKCVAAGEDWPDGAENDEPGREVLYCDTESAHAFMAERAQAWGLPLDRVLMPGRDGTWRLRLEEAEGLLTVRRAVRESGARLVVIDSLRGALTGEENSSEVAEVLGPWAALAQTEDVAVVLVHHSRKGSGGRVDLDAVRGSSAFGAIARSILGLRAERALGDEDGLAVRVEQVKSNFGPLQEGLRMRVGPEGCEFSNPAQDPLARLPEDAGPALSAATEYLVGVLADGPVARARCLEECMAAAKCGRSTVYRAVQQLGVRTVALPGAENYRERAWAL